MRRSQADSTNRSLAAFGKLQHIRRRARNRVTHERTASWEQLEWDHKRDESIWGGIVKLRLTAVSDAQHGGFTTGSNPASWGLID